MTRFEFNDFVIDLNKVTSFSKDVICKVIYDEETLNKTIIYYFKVKLGCDKFIFKRTIEIPKFIPKSVHLWKFHFNLKKVNPEWKKFNISKLLLEQIKEKDHSTFSKYFAIKTNTLDLYNEVNNFKNEFINSL